MRFPNKPPSKPNKGYSASSADARWHAVRHGRLNVAISVLSLDSDIISVVSALSWAAGYCHVEVAIILAHRGVNAASEGGVGALRTAVTYGHLDIEKLLLESRANAAAATSDRLLELAAAWGRVDALAITSEQPLRIYVHQGPDGALGLYSNDNRRLTVFLMFQVCRRRLFGSCDLWCSVHGKLDAGGAWPPGSHYEGNTDGLSIEPRTGVHAKPSIECVSSLEMVPVQFVHSRGPNNSFGHTRPCKPLST